MMHKFLFFICCLFITFNVHASNLVLEYFDGTYHEETDLASAHYGEVTGVSNINYVWDVLEKQMIVTQDEWFSDGNGGEFLGANKDIFYHSGLSVSNIKELFPWDDWQIISDYFIEEASNELTIDSLFDYAKTISKTSIISNSINSRLKTVNNDSNFSFWGDFFYDDIREHKTDGYNSDAFGFVIAGDKVINNHFIFGFGVYADISNLEISFINDLGRSYDFFFYNQYKNKRFYINWMFDYGKNYFGESTFKNYLLRLFAGYNISDSFATKAGVKYIYIPKYTYKYDDFYLFDSEHSDITTFIYGIEYLSNILCFDIVFDANVMIDLNKDFGSFNSLFLEKYIDRDNSNPFGFSGNVQLIGHVSDIDISISYELETSSLFTSHAVKLGLKKAL